MLKQLRHKKTAKRIFIFLAIVIIPAFAFWGFSSVLRGPKESGYAGRIFGKSISLLEYGDAYEGARNQAIMQFGDKFLEAQKYLDLEAQAWQRLILLYEAGKRKIKVSDAQVIRQIESYPVFQRNGKFDDRLYAERLRYYFRAQPRVFEEQTRQNLALSKLYRQLTDSVNLSEDEIKKDYQKLNSEMSLYYIAGLPSEFAKFIWPSEQEIKDYFAKNSLDFKVPLSFNVEYLAFDSENKARQATLQIRKKNDLAKVAKDLNLSLKETGLFSQIDPIPGIGWSPEIMNLISNLRASKFSPLIQVDKNYYILRLKERKEPYIPDLEKIKDKVREKFIKDGSNRVAKQKIEDCLKKLKESYRINPKAVDFKKVAKEGGLTWGSTDFFKYGSYIAGIGASDNFWTQAEGLEEDGFSGIITTQAGFYIIKLKSKTHIDEKKFESEKSEFSLKLLEQKKEEYFTKFAEELFRKSGIPK
jgi:peptidyl-prolyl cis-trans isomerase D